jgi:hypothetical protein
MAHSPCWLLAMCVRPPSPRGSLASWTVRVATHRLARVTSAARPRFTCAARRYDVTTFSRPVHPLALASYPITRFFQRKYGRDSAAHMVRAVAGELGEGGGSEARR